MPIFQKIYPRTIPALLQSRPHLHRQPRKPCYLLLGALNTTIRLSTSGYGDDISDPRAEHPQSQGVSQRSRDIEHPGPRGHEKKPSKPAHDEKKHVSESTGSPLHKGSGEHAPPSHSIPRSAREEYENASEK